MKEKQGSLRRDGRSYVLKLCCLALTALVFISVEKSFGRSPPPRPTAVTAEASPIVRANRSTDVIGTVIHFNAGGGSEPYRVSGWSKTEQDFTWTEGRSAKLALPIRMDPGPLTLEMGLVGLISAPKLEEQKVDVIVDGHKLVDWQVGGAWKAYTVVIPEEWTKGRSILNIELVLHTAISPQSLGLSNDPRVLAVSCSTLELKQP